MSGSSKTVIIVAGIAALVVIGGAGAYFLLAGKSNSSTIVEFVGKPAALLEDVDSLVDAKESAETVAHLRKGMTVDVVGIVAGRKWAQVTLPDKRTAYIPLRIVQLEAASSFAASDSAPSAAAVAAFQADQANAVSFDTVSEVYTPDRVVTVYVEPNVHAPQIFQVDPGTNIPVIARSKDGVWVMASTMDGSPAFLLVSELGTARPGKAKVAAAPADLPDTVDGTAQATSTSSISVNGQQVDLSGVEGEAGDYVAQLQKIIDGAGGTLHCVRQDQQYLCKLPNGIDIALSALYLGAARPTSDAPDNYQAQAKAAQDAGRGIWHTAQ